MPTRYDPTTAGEEVDDDLESPVVTFQRELAERPGPEVCASGLWVDAATGQVVESAPETGRQIVPPGGLLRKDRLAAVEAARAAAPVVVESDSVIDPEPEPAPEPVKVPAAKKAAKA